jgi:hypothetical protein
MMSEAIAFVLTHLPVLLFIAAFALALFMKRPARFAARLLDWLLLLSVGVETLWAGIFHVFFPNVAARSIGWSVSPFQFEIGVADIAIGIVAILSFWRSLDFKAAVIGYISLFYAGVAIGHVHEAISAGNFAPNNFGLLLALTVIKMVLLPILYMTVKKQQRTA